MPIKTTTYPHWNSPLASTVLAPAAIAFGAAGDAVVTSPSPRAGAATGVGAAYDATVSTQAGGSDPNYYGWTAPDPSDNTYANYTIPPEFPAGVKPFHDNVGLFDPARRAALTTHSGDFTVTANNQLIHDLKITGKLITGNFTGVKVFFCEVQKGTDSSRAAGNGTEPCYVYCDLGNSTAGDNIYNTRGGASFYRCNSWGYLDGPSPGGTSGTFYKRDCFTHDLRYCTDQGQGPNEASHNDCCQPKGNGATYELVNNVEFCWTIYNYSVGGTVDISGRQETATRSSGPHWYDTTGSPDDGSSQANPWHGYQTGGMLLGTAYATSVVNLRRCDYRGNANQYIVMRGAGGVVQDCRFSSNEQATSYRPLCIFNETYFDSVTGNVYGPWDPRAGQPIDG